MFRKICSVLFVGALAVSLMGAALLPKAEETTSSAGTGIASSLNSAALRPAAVSTTATPTVTNLGQLDKVFPDPALAQIVADTLYKWTYDDITTDDLDNVIRLEASGAGIKSLEGMQYCKNIDSIDLSNNKITDISPLKGIRGWNLVVTLDNNQITDLSPMAGNPDLISLSANNNKIASFSVLATGTALAGLSLSGNQITDLSPLLMMPQLEGIDFSRNPLSKAGKNVLAPLKNLVKLDTLFLDSAGLTDISSIPVLPKLITLRLDGNHITDFSPLAKEKALIELHVENNGLTSASSLSKITSLGILYASNNKLTDISGLAFLKNIWQLDISHNNITVITALGSLTNLDDLDASYNHIVDVTPLGKCEYLSTIKLQHNDIVDPSPLHPSPYISMPGGNRLDISNNHIYDVSTINYGYQFFVAVDQTIILPAKNKTEPFVLKNIVTYGGGHPIPIKDSSISNGGTYSSATNNITWRKLGSAASVSYRFTDMPGSFTGIVIQPLTKHAQPKVLPFTGDRFGFSTWLLPMLLVVALIILILRQSQMTLLVQ